MYIISKIETGYILKIYSRDAKSAFKVQKYYEALAILQQLGLHLKQEDKLLVA